MRSPQDVDEVAHRDQQADEDHQRQRASPFFPDRLCAPIAWPSAQGCTKHDVDKVDPPIELMLTNVGEDRVPSPRSISRPCSKPRTLLDREARVEHDLFINSIADGAARQFPSSPPGNAHRRQSGEARRHSKHHSDTLPADGSGILADLKAADGAVGVRITSQPLECLPEILLDEHPPPSAPW